jgi:hypothetical protein
MIDRPIFVVGTGRCGSTLLHRLLARHPQVGWLSTFNEVFPRQHWLSRFSNLYRWDWLGNRIRHLAFFPKPFEAYRFWDAYLGDFSRRDRPLEAQDVPAAAIEPVRAAVGRILHHQGRARFLAKVTGWSRIAYFDRIFPDGRYVWLNREPRAVVSSWVKAGWLDVTSSPDSDGWQWGDVSAPYYTLWRELGGDPLLSAALKIQLDLDDIRANMAQVPGRAVRLEYEDLIREPVVFMRRLADFADLEWDRSFERFLASFTFHDQRDKWRRHLSEADGERILAFFERAAVARPAPQAVNGRIVEPTSTR